MKKSINWVIMIVITYGFIELISLGGLFYLKKYKNVKYKPIDVISSKQTAVLRNFIAQKTEYYSFSPSLGWTIKNNGTSTLYKANSSGIRSNKEYQSIPRQGIYRISAFGDSFTHGTDVKNSDTWPSFMESYDSSLEVLNFGVGAYGLDQSYLRYLEDGSQFKSNIVLIGFMTENIFRHVSTFRPFYYPQTRFPLTKPRFMLGDNGISLLPNPMQSLQDYNNLLTHPRDVLSEIGANDYFFNKRGFASSVFDWSAIVRLVKIYLHTVTKSPKGKDIIVKGKYNKESAAFIVTKRIFNQFYNATITNKSKPIIVIFPNKKDIARYYRHKTKIYPFLPISVRHFL